MKTLTQAPKTTLVSLLTATALGTLAMASAPAAADVAT